MSYIRSLLPARNHTPFELPKEHGAVAVFSLSTVVSLCLCHTELTAVTSALIMLWLMMMSTHCETLLLIVTALSMLLMCLSGNVPVALLFLLVFLGIAVTQISQAAKDLWWKEIVGLSGAALAPLAVSSLLSGYFQSTILASLAFLASIMTGLCLIHACRPELRVNPLTTALLSLFFWVLLAGLKPMLALVSLLPFCLQVLWILKVKRPHFKQLGLAQGACMTIISLAILFLN